MFFLRNCELYCEAFEYPATSLVTYPKRFATKLLEMFKKVQGLSRARVKPANPQKRKKLKKYQKREINS